LGKFLKQTFGETSKKIWNKISGEKIWKTKFKNKFWRKNFGNKNFEAKNLEANLISSLEEKFREQT
jgi:hypothetical protein